MDRRLSFAIALSAALLPAQAQDPDIDRLLRKLPAPEKLINPQIAPGLRLTDPIFRDPLAKDLDKAIKANNAPRALGITRKLAERHPRSVAAHFLRGSIALRTAKYGEASDAFRRTVALEPGLSVAHLGLGVAEGAVQRFSAALPSLQQATRLEPKRVESWIFLSECCLRLDRKKESVRAARRATTLAPNSAVTWRQLASAENASGHRAEALLAMDKANRISPYLDPRIPRPADALPALRRAAQLQPRNSGVHFELGATLLRVGKPNEAMVALQKSVSLNPKHAAAWRELGVAYRKLGRHREANAAFAETDRLMPEIAALVALAKQKPAGRPKKPIGSSVPTAETRRR